MNVITALRLWIARLKLRLLHREIQSTSDDIRDCRSHGDWTRARVLSDYAIDLNTERRRLTAHINFLNAKG